MNGFNNKYSELAPFMSDSRLFTSYDPNYETNDNFMEKNNIQTNYDYRQFLIHNANEIIDNNNKEHCMNVGTCRFSMEPYSERNPEGKYLYKGHSDQHKPYGYETSDMKEKYVSRDALQSRLAAPILNQQDLLSYPRNQ